MNAINFTDNNAINNNFYGKIINILKSKIFRLTLYLLIFSVYLFLGLKFVVELDSAMQINYIFGADSPRIYYDWTSINYDHYRTSVHPLYVMIVYPFTYPLTRLTDYYFNSAVIGIALFTTIISVLNVLLFDKLLKELYKNKSQKLEPIRLLLVLIFATSFTALENCIIVETYTLCLFSILSFLLYITKIKDNELHLKQYVILTLLGVLCASFLITNFIIFIIGLAFLILFNKKKDAKSFFKDVLKCLAIIISSFLALAMLCSLQKHNYSSCTNAVEYIFSTLKGFFLKQETTEELSYISSISSTNFINLYKSFFAYAFIGGTLSSGAKLEFLKFNIFNYIFSILLLSLLIFSIAIQIKNKNYSFLTFVALFVFDCVLHLLYGNSELLIYTLQIIPLILIIISMGIPYLFNSKHRKTINFIILGLLASILLSQLILNVKTLLNIKTAYFVRFGTTNVLIKKPFLMITSTIITISLFCYFITKKFTKFLMKNY